MAQQQVHDHDIRVLVVDDERPIRFLMEKELQFLGSALAAPDHPFVAILGGAKISDKIGVIDNLLGQVDAILIGGGMANTFLKADGYDVADSLVEDESLATARRSQRRGWRQHRRPGPGTSAAADVRVRAGPLYHSGVDPLLCLRCG